MMKYIIVLVFTLLTGYAPAQHRNVIDKIVAVVGEEIVLKSDIENELLHLRQQSQSSFIENPDTKAQLLERLLINKLLLAQAKIDSIFATDEQVEKQLNSQIEYYIRQSGSQEKLEAYFGKSIEEIKNEMRVPMRDNIITSQMQQKIVEAARVTPSEVRHFYKQTDKDSLPEVGDKYELQQIVVRPKISNEEKERVRNRLRGFRDDILAGKQSFQTLAVLYSEDNVSATRGGELGYMSKNDLVPEFAEAAFSLKPGKLSKIVETEYGFHLIQYIDRQGDRMNVRHILLRPKIEEKARKEALSHMDTIMDLLKKDEIPFEYVAQRTSDDTKTRLNGGLIINQEADSKLLRESIRGEMARQVAKLKVGEISAPFLDQDGPIEEYKIIRLKAFHPSHKANLEDDWNTFEQALLRKKQQELFEKWIREKQESTYIHIDEDYQTGKFTYKGWIK